MPVKSKTAKKYLIKAKFKSFKDGAHNLTFKATDVFGNAVENNISFIVDSAVPKIILTLPKANRITNGSDFSVKYSEENLNKVVLVYNETEMIEYVGCESGKNKICSADIDLEDFDNQELTYHFIISDELRNVSSKNVTVHVDTTIPEINVTLPINETIYGKRVPFAVNASEEVKLEYMDDILGVNETLRWRSLCSNCGSYGIERAKTVSFKPGVHEILIRASDKAGNAVVERREFEVV